MEDAEIKEQRAKFMSRKEKDEADATWENWALNANKDRFQHIKNFTALYVLYNHFLGHLYK